MQDRRPSPTAFLTVTEEIEKMFREGRPYCDAVEATVSRRLREVSRHCRLEMGPAVEAAHDIADSAFRGTLKHGITPVLSARTIQRGVTCACGAWGPGIAEVISSASKAIFAHALEGSPDPESIAINLVLGTIQGSRQLETDPSPPASAVAWGLLDLASKQDPKLARRIRIGIRKILIGLRLEWRSRAPRMNRA